ncbi:phospholipase D-like domain-containing protein [Altericroceibacterium xinjiangense]|uniref:phospholipase D-like domain-containing protein n=1 Tax=Altericroceibacterium xinjiangense TaxID=762261 RepID=UPI0013DF1FC9|nr:phosphatidylserine/phosphatidylglycerophosphate/cardiolipin synthase family protein [Altericroceibacterium xinjiangense]
MGTEPHLPGEARYRESPPFAVRAQGLDLVFYPRGADRLKRLIELIESAEKTLKLTFYIFAADDSGRTVRDALASAARRGVAVKLLVDAFGGANPGFFSELEEAGGEFCLFEPRIGRRYLIRNHQKIVIVDDRIAMMGGFNIEDSYFAPPEEDGWNDLAFTLEGAVVDQLCDWFARLEKWTENPKAQFTAIRRMVRRWDGGSGPVQLLLGGPTRGLSSWARSVSHDLIEGRRLDMIMAYFAPAHRLTARVCQIARRGEARLVLGARSDNPATVGAARSLYSRLLRAGTRIFEFQPCKLHTKLIVLGDAVYLGSANFDLRSLYLNLEIVLRIEDKALADRMREFITEHVPASEAITPALHRKRATWWNRMRWKLCWFLVSGVDYTVTRKLNLGLG